MVGPIACALDQPQLEDRMRRWRELGARLPAGVELRPDGVRLDFAPDLELARELPGLVAAERDCCGWAEWTVTNSSRGTRLDVVADAAGTRVLHLMFGVDR